MIPVEKIFVFQRFAISQEQNYAFYIGILNNIWHEMSILVWNSDYLSSISLCLY